MLLLLLSRSGLSALSPPPRLMSTLSRGAGIDEQLAVTEDRPKKISKEHKRKISESLKRYHKTCKKSKSKSKSTDNTEKQMKSFLAGIKTKSKSKAFDMNKKQLQKEIEKLKKMINI